MTQKHFDAVEKAVNEILVYLKSEERNPRLEQWLGEIKEEFNREIENANLFESPENSDQD